MSDLSTVGRAVFDASFGDRVRALLRARPVADAADNAARQAWGEYGYDVVTLALAAIDTVIARQGLDDEVTYDEAVAGLVGVGCERSTGASRRRTQCGRAVRSGRTAEPSGT